MYSVKKAALMHKIFGINPYKTCNDCVNLVRYKHHDKPYRKCALYGVTNSEATDWTAKSVACGRWGQPVRDGEKPVIELKKHIRRFDNEPIKGQISIFHLE